MTDLSNTTINIIGAGHVAHHLATQLFLKGVKIHAIWSNTFANAKNLAQKVGAVAVENLKDVDPEINCCILSVKDDALDSVVDRLPQTKSLVVHTSGMRDLSVLSKKFRNVGVFYPLQTFSKQRDINFEHIPVFVEAGDQEYLKKLLDLAGLLGASVYQADSETRKKLHLAAVFVSNFVNYMYQVGYEILSRESLDFDVLKPLIKEVAEKVMELPPEKAQTGPAKRGDIKTIALHEQLLRDYDLKYLEIYQLLTKQIREKYHEL
jgi:predicted short-subunit dehydrogenase-like oxidoreductase (DUF2520 family)